MVPGTSIRTRVILVGGISLLPAVLMGLGLAGRATSIGAAGFSRSMPSGVLAHTGMEWAIVFAALLIGLLALIDWRIERLARVPVMGIALMGVAILHAAHLLVTNDLLSRGQEALGASPMTWAVARSFTAVIVAMAAATLTGSAGEGGSRRRVSVVVCTCGIWTLAGLVLVAFCWKGLGPHNALFPTRLVVRPWDIGPLLLLTYAGLGPLRRFHAGSRRFFTQGLLLGIVPQGIAQLHMILGAESLFGPHATAAHLLVLVGLLLPLAGLVTDLLRAQTSGERTMRHLEEAQHELEQRGSELERVVQEVSRRNSELDEFTYIASHDLQEPLRKLTAFSELLRKDLGDDLPRRAAKDLEFIVDAAGRMQTLVRDLLELSRVSRNEIERRQVPLEECVEQALEALAMIFAESNTAFSVDPLPVVWGDRTLLAQLYQNLIGNALKFTREATRSRIHLTVERRDGRLILGVQDNGIGIAPEHTTTIFAPFKRLHGRAQYEGTGIGLSICRKTVERHGGEIWVESRPGEGAHFRFTLEEVTGEDANPPGAATPVSAEPAATPRP